MAAQYSPLIGPRHPASRLVSAYRNKLESRNASRAAPHFYTTYSSQIIKYIGISYIAIFVFYISSSLRKSRGSFSPGDPEPTFAEFVRYLVSTPVHQYDMHWAPIARRCRW